MMYWAICHVAALYTVTHLQEPHHLFITCLSVQYTSSIMSNSVGICLHFYANCPTDNETSIHCTCDNRKVSLHCDELLNHFLCQHWESTVKSMWCTTHSDFKCLFFFLSLSLSLSLKTVTPPWLWHLRWHLSSYIINQRYFIDHGLIG